MNIEVSTLNKMTVLHF